GQRLHAAEAEHLPGRRALGARRRRERQRQEESADHLAAFASFHCFLKDVIASVSLAFRASSIARFSTIVFTMSACREFICAISSDSNAPIFPTGISSK